jgi:4-hydroxy-tetrahydrodipicolinate synthase
MEKMKEIKGIFPVLATPFENDGTIDETGLRNIIRFVLNAGAHGITFPAVASEFYTLSEKERKQLSEVVIEEVQGKIPVILTVSAPSTAIAVDLARHAQTIGAESVMLMAPYVVKDSFSGIRKYFEKVADAIDLPIVLQNAPAPLGSAQSVEAVIHLLKGVPQIRFVKEENMPCGQRITKLLEKAPNSLLGIFGGAGGRYMLDELTRGAVGVMPACELTEIHVVIYNHFMNEDPDTARQIYYRLLPLLNFQAVFRMAMTKEVLYHRGIIEHTHVRIGNIELDKTDRQELITLLDDIDDLYVQNSAKKR